MGNLEMSRKLTLIAVVVIAAASNIATAQQIVPGSNGPQIMPSPVSGRYIPVSEGQYPIYVSDNKVTGINPQTGGWDTENRQIDNTVNQIGRNESQNNGTKRWVRRPVHDAQGKVVGYQEGYVWNNSYTGQEHGELINYTPNGSGGVNSQYQSRSAAPGVHRNHHTYGVHRNVQSKL